MKRFAALLSLLILLALACGGTTPEEPALDTEEIAVQTIPAITSPTRAPTDTVIPTETIETSPTPGFSPTKTATPSPYPTRKPTATHTMAALPIPSPLNTQDMQSLIEWAKKRTQVVVYGSSLTMATVAASLKVDQSLEVICVDPRSPTARQYLRELNPAAIAFDLNDPPQSMEAILLRERPEVLLIGIDPTNDEILILSSRPQQARSASDLVSVIQEYSQSVQ